MDDLNLHIIFFSVLLACAQSFIQMNKMISEEEVKCEDTGSDKFSNYDWSRFENHINLPKVTKEIEPNFHLYRQYARPTCCSHPRLWIQKRGL